MLSCSEQNFKQLSDAISRLEHYIGTKTDPEENTITWYINKIKESINIIGDNCYVYESPERKKLHIIQHNLNSNYLDINITAQNEHGQYEKILCGYTLINSNTLEIDLSEEESLIVTVSKLK